MKLGLIVFLWGFVAFADSPPEVGNLSGLIFTGSILHQPMNIQGGTYSDCEKTRGNTFDIYKCSVKGSTISVKVSELKTETYYFDELKVVLHKERRHYYYHGHRLISINNREFAQPVVATINMNLSEKDRVYGYLELSQSTVRSSFEAIR